MKDIKKIIFHIRIEVPFYSYNSTKLNSKALKSIIKQTKDMQNETQ